MLSNTSLKLYVPAIDGIVPQDMVRSIVALLDFCYLVRRDVHTPATILRVKKHLEKFQKYREIFRETRT